jgi:predicted lysophospholipase L1 biosynthesis ABC-type transport system permease subunit
MDSLGKNHIGDTPQKTRALPLLIMGSVLGAFVLLFGMANDDWVVIHFPSAPWSSEPAWAMFETRLWAVMLASLVLGVAGTWIIALVARSKWTKMATRSQDRIQALEREIEKTNRLLSATRKSR